MSFFKLGKPTLNSELTYTLKRQKKQRLSPRVAPGAANGRRSSYFQSICSVLVARAAGVETAQRCAEMM